jgi:8-oxo-dGTP diphosphatase
MDVVAGILWRGGRYLAVRRPEGVRMAGFWEFPGGKIDPGEGPEQALVRELEEELGVLGARPVFWRELTHEYPEFPVRLRFFHVYDFEGEPEPREGQTLRWCDPADAQDLAGMEFLEADAPIVAALRDGLGQKDEIPSPK